MSVNIFELRSRGKQASSSDKRTQDVDDLKKSVDDALRDQLLNECRRKHGFTKPKPK